MTARLFVDTNVLVYAYDRSEMEKMYIARETLRTLASTRTGVISPQVLAEFFNTVTRKLAAPLSLSEGEARVQNFVRIWHMADLTGAIVLEAIRGTQAYQFSFWDAQIWAAAKLTQVPVVLSEDFNAGAMIEGVRFANPFDPSFNLDDWI